MHQNLTEPAAIRLDHPRFGLSALELCCFDDLAIAVPRSPVTVGEHFDALDLLLVILAVEVVGAFDRLPARATRLGLLVAGGHVSCRLAHFDGAERGGGAGQAKPLKKFQLLYAAGRTDCKGDDNRQ